jgi:hypothetical protein
MSTSCSLPTPREVKTYEVSHHLSRSDKPWPPAPEYGIVGNEVAQQAIEQEQSSQYPQHIHNSDSAILGAAGSSFALLLRGCRYFHLLPTVSQTGVRRHVGLVSFLRARAVGIVLVKLRRIQMRFKKKSMLAISCWLIK